MSDDTTLDTNVVAAAADLGRRAADAAESRRIHIDIDEPGTSVQIVPVRDDEKLEHVDAEKYLVQPRRARGGATFHDPTSFGQYVAHIDGAPSLGRVTIWADDEARKVAAVFNDHNSPTDPGWRDHTAVFNARVDPDWQAWLAANGVPMPQVRFGEFLHDMVHTIVDPPAAELIAIATTFTAKRNLTYESSARLQSGDVELVYREETTTKAGKGKVEIPERFTLRLTPFFGAESIEIAARLRYDIGDGRLMLSFKLQRPDIAEREAFGQLVEAVRVEVGEGMPILFGAQPEPLRA